MKYRGSMGLVVVLAACQGADAPSRDAHLPAQATRAEAEAPPACVASVAAVEEVRAPIDRTASDVAATAQSIVANVLGGAVASTDGGATWTPLPFVAKRIEADATGYVAVDPTHTVWLGDADAQRWVEAREGLPALPVEHVARGGGVSLAIAGGLAYRWSGAEWLPLAPTGEAPVERVVTDGDAFLATDAGGLFTSADGAAWTKAPVETSWAYRGLSIAGARRLASSFFQFARSDDGGLTWIVDEATHAAIGVADTILDEGPLTLAAGWNGVFSSADGGFTWTSVPGTTGTSAVGLARHQDSYLVAAQGLHRHDGDGWRLEDRLRARFIDRLIGVGDALFATTSDLGAHRAVGGDWETMSLDPIAAAVEHRGATFALTGGTQSTSLARSDDGGATWTTLPHAAGTPAAQIGALLSLGDHLLVGSTATSGGGSTTGTTQPGIGIHYSSDGGLTYRQATGLPMIGYHDANTTRHPPVTLLFAVGEIAYAALDGVGLYRSHDRGVTWSVASRDDAIDRAAVLSDGVGVIGTSRAEGRLLRVEEGRIVAARGEGLPSGFRVAALIGHGPILVASLLDDEGLYLSDDGGDTFTHHPFGDARAMALAGGALWIAVEGEGLRRVSIACD